MGYFEFSRYYVRVGRELLVIRNVATGKEYRANDNSPFQHPRVIVSNFEKAVGLVREGLRQTHSFSLFRPIVIMHWVDTLEGGISAIESRALKEIGFAAGGRRGAYRVFVIGPTVPADDLSDDLLQSIEKKYPNA
jgi:hypothetical protein